MHLNSYRITRILQIFVGPTYFMKSINYGGGFLTMFSCTVLVENVSIVCVCEIPNSHWACVGTLTLTLK